MRVHLGFLVLSLAALQSYCQPIVPASEGKNVTNVISMRSSRMKRMSGEGKEDPLIDDMWLSPDQLSQPISGPEKGRASQEDPKFRRNKRTPKWGWSPDDHDWDQELERRIRIRGFKEKNIIRKPRNAGALDDGNDYFFIDLDKIHNVTKTIGDFKKNLITKILG